MARPTKTGIDYFPLDVNMDDKIELIEAKHGIEGFGIVVKLYQKIYKEGYFLKLTEELLLLTSKRINVNINKLNDVINDCLKYDLFNIELYEKYKVLTSSGIQKRYFEAINRRKSIELDKNIVITDISGINADINWINSDIGTQSKVKERKEKKIKVEEIKYYRKFEHLKLTIDEFEKINKNYSKEKIDSILNDIENYKKNTNYKSLYLTALKWLKKENPKLRSNEDETNKVWEDHL